MILAPEAEREARITMKKNLATTKQISRLSSSEKALILHTSFWNHLLRFIVIDGEEYPTNSEIHISEEFIWNYTNPHEKNIRVSYDHRKEILFIETMKLIPHPFLASQRIDRDHIVGVMIQGHEACGFINPNEKVPEWKRMGEEIPVNKILSINIESFIDRPAIWMEGDDHTAYRMFVETEKK